MSISVRKSKLYTFILSNKDYVHNHKELEQVTIYSCRFIV